MIFCYTHRPLPIPVVIREASPSNFWKQLQRPNQTLGEHPGIPWNRGERIMGSSGAKNIKGKHTESTDLGLWEFMGTEPPENLHRTDLGPLHVHVLSFCGLVFLCDSWKKEQCLVSDSVPVLGSLPFYLFSFNKRGGS